MQWSVMLADLTFFYVPILIAYIGLNVISGNHSVMIISHDIRINTPNIWSAISYGARPGIRTHTSANN